MDRVSLHRHNPRQKSSDVKKRQNIKRRSLLQKSRRDYVLNKHRDLSPVRETRQYHSRREDGVRLKERLREWKHQRDQRKQLEKRKQRPAFKVSHIDRDRDDRKVFSAIIQPVSKGYVGPSRNTRSQARSKFDNNHNMYTRDVSRRGQAKHSQSHDEKPKNRGHNTESAAWSKHSSDDAGKRKSFAPANFTFKPPEGLPILDFDESLSDSMTSKIYDQDLTTINRPKLRSTTASLEENRIAGPEKLESSRKYHETYKKLHTTATKRLQEQCEKWKSNLQAGVVKDAQNKVQSVIDQADRLLDKQLKKYNTILNKSTHCKRNPDILKDHEKFWSLISIEVESLLNKFKSLEAVKIMTQNEDYKPHRKDCSTDDKGGKMSTQAKPEKRRSLRIMAKNAKTGSLDEEIEKEEVCCTITVIPESPENNQDTLLSETQENVVQSRRLAYSSTRRCRSSRRTPVSQKVSRSSVLMRGKLDFDDEENDKENEVSTIAAKYLLPSVQAVCHEPADSNHLDAKYLMTEGTPVSSNRKSMAATPSVPDSATGDVCKSTRSLTKDNGRVNCLQSTGDLITFSPA